MPWKGLLVRNNGEARVCIQSQTASNNGVIKNHAAEPAKIDHVSINDIRNLPLLRELRQTMLRGESHPHCTRCDREDACGLPSARKQHRFFWQKDFTFFDSLQATKEDGEIDTKQTAVGFLDLRIGNQCNLKCRMCGPSESTAWYEEHFATVGKGFRLYSERVELTKVGQKVVVGGGLDFGWVESPDAWRNIEDHLAGIRLLHIVGGEPLLDQRHYSTLERIISLGRASQVILDYNTNLTVLPPRALELWRQFAQVRIGASIDATGAALEYIRFPARWQRVEENFRKLAREKGSLNIWPTTTVQILNAYEILDLYRWRLRLNAEIEEWREGIPLLKIHPVHSPVYYSLLALPIAEKQRLHRHYDEFLLQLNGILQEILAPAEVIARWRQEIEVDIRALQTFLFSKDEYAHFSEFIVRNEKMDKFRQQSFMDVYPELAKRLLNAKQMEGSLNGSPVVS
jgi:MoaA/NifB/PqqE/SkfB family radical SAM enzyme